MKQLLLMAISGWLLLASTVANSGQYVLVSSSPGTAATETFSKQLSDWYAAKVLSSVELFEGETAEGSQFGTLGILGFADAAALQNWHQLFAFKLPQGMQVTEVDVLANLGSSAVGSSNAVFQVMQYDVLVDRAEFEDYIDGYQMAEMVVRKEHGGLVRYTSFYAKQGSTAPWQSLIIMEYRDEAAMAASKEVNKALGEQLMERDARFSSFKQTKDGIRTKTGTTVARAVLRNP